MAFLDLDADVKPYLRITSADDDLELQTVVDGAEAAIGRAVGPLTPETVTENVYASGGSLVLSRWPVASLTSVTPSGGTALDVSGLDARAGVITYLSRGTSFALTTAPYSVAYQVGWTTVPNDIKLAALEMVRHLWATNRGSGNARPRPQGDIANSMPGAAYTFPIRVEQLLAPYRVSGFA